MPEVAAAILVDETLQPAFQRDSPLLLAYVESMREIHADEVYYSRYATAYNSRLNNLREAIATNAGAPLANALRYAAADPRSRKTYSAGIVGHDIGAKCGMGPARVTFQQARALGLLAQPDIVLTSDEAIDLTREEIMERLRFAHTQNPTDWTTYRNIETLSGQVCIVGIDLEKLPDDDHRSDMEALGTKIAEYLTKNEDLPSKGSDQWLIARIALFYLGDTNIDLSTDEPLSEALNLNKPRQRVAFDRTATLMARATVIPCIGVLGDDRPKGLRDTPLPAKGTCERLYELLDAED